MLQETDFWWRFLTAGCVLGFSHLAAMVRNRKKRGKKNLAICWRLPPWVVTLSHRVPWPRSSLLLAKLSAGPPLSLGHLFLSVASPALSWWGAALLSGHNLWLVPLSKTFSLLFRATPTPYRSSQARGQIGAAAASLLHSHSNSGSKPRLQPTPQLTAMPDPEPNEWGQGSNPRPQGY